MTTNANLKTHIDAHLKIERQIAQLKKELQVHREVLIAGLSHRRKTALVIDGFKISHKEVVSKRIDTSKLKIEYPEIAAACTNEQKSLRFLVGLDKGGK